MGKIIQLDDALSNKIAAGEVVERPASVVKELMENSIDAGSTIIEIEAEEAGLAKIRIIDNGDGIEEDDVLNAFHRHATSKIKDENDLFRIRTLGFRGEALPSIASVSRIEMKTSTGDDGTRVVIEGGKVEVMEKAPGRKGTDLTVTDLFFNTPARLKYMKTIHTELGNITDVVNRLALAHPEVAIRLIHNERKLLQTNGNGDVRQVLAAIYGLNIVKKMVRIEASSLDFKISGYAAMPEITRASRNYISTMINGRFIKNYSLAKAIQEGYHTLLPIGRYPIVLLNIEMDPLLVDVNVHPSKMEVRLSKEHELNELVSDALKAAFKKEELIPSGFTQPKTMKPKSEQTALELDHLPEHREHVPSFVREAREDAIRQYPNGADPQSPQSLPGEPAAAEYPDLQDAPLIDLSPSAEELPEADQHIFQPEEPRAAGLEQFLAETATVDEPSRVPPLYPIGQMHGTYIFAQNDRGLYIIDQHAAQERIKYEYFREKVGQVESELQEMLIPLTFEYSTDDYIKIDEYKGELEKVGVFLEQFGHNSFIVRSHPQWLPKGEEQEIIEDMIEQLLAMKRVDIKKLREEAAIMMSCKASIKANHHLRNDEIQALLDELRRSSDPFTCPHGRPIIIHYSTYEMEKMFKRVM
ncbi:MULTISPECIES: DNA mismatch repair endonuclease MutL [Cytobacillus]|uniref:DNA mismatch repair protein MutL n=3 Tax=Cytobacillus TaxID=2675230 RepID=A0A161JU57_9BACI|nr:MULTISPECIES: DNA mismatch repair endonuclease MutL [Cytobacillus]EFV79314.1 DNA mismatch repair protein [Bacillus sp. 2_A_57_CT2]AND39491.1 DNA mismatch repair protein MutL [Cytobacillus oceanisediminis 2691]MCM3400880.1 DNA mismatch repair endonuclease MutL [Cytobacillus oceanisediminis]MDK7665147.1 DNA mismatch repair endonuclease MutL [Cytobacillus oceanisediminis]OHX49446.1 DNA mismatch repair protein MutL [Cytobacillus oceanisediminis]